MFISRRMWHSKFAGLIVIAGMLIKYSTLVFVCPAERDNSHRFIGSHRAHHQDYMAVIINAHVHMTYFSVFFEWVA